MSFCILNATDGIFPQCGNVTPQHVMGPNGTYCFQIEWYSHVVAFDNALKVAAGCFIVGVLWGIFLTYLYLRYYYAPA